MKGLLLKDAFVIRKTCKAFILLDIVFIAFSFFEGENMFFLFYPAIISGMLPMTLISLDEKEKWDQYAATLPVTRAQLVSSKYLIGLFGNIIVLVLIAVAQAFRMSREGKFVTEKYFFILVMLLSVGLMIPAILYPLVFRFGIEKGRIFYYITIGAACGGAVSFNYISIKSFVKANDFLIMAILLTVVILLYAASWLLSIRFYKNREL